MWTRQSPELRDEPGPLCFRFGADPAKYTGQDELISECIASFPLSSCINQLANSNDVTGKDLKHQFAHGFITEESRALAYFLLRPHFEKIGVSPQDLYRCAYVGAAGLESDTNDVSSFISYPVSHS